jgi:hypothetical protein
MKNNPAAAKKHILITKEQEDVLNRIKEMGQMKHNHQALAHIIKCYNSFLEIVANTQKRRG